jgi:pre-mRNA-splicing factor 38A
MANVTDPLVSHLSGTDPQNLMEYITRQKIYDSRYWKEECFGLSAVNVLEKSVETLQCIGGLPCHFLSLVLKLLQLHPDHEIVQKAFVEQDTFKYTRALGCLYIRLTSRPTEVYNTLEPLLSDHRKLRVWTGTNQNRWDVTTVDQFVYDLLQTTSSSSTISTSSSISYLGIIIPRLPSRKVLQEAGYIMDGPRIVSSEKLHATLLRYMNLNDEHESEEMSTERYAKAALQYLEYKAKIQQLPSAIQAYEKQQHLQKHSIELAAASIVSATQPITNHATTLSITQFEKELRPNEAVLFDGTGVDTTSKTSEPNAQSSIGTTTVLKPTTSKIKKRNYGSLFKS